MPQETQEQDVEIRDDSDELDGVETQETEGETQEPAPQDEMKQALSELLRMETERKQKESTKPEAEMTPEEKAKAWGLYDPKSTNKEFFRKFFRLDAETPPEQEQEYEAMFADMQKGLVRQAIIGALNIIRGEDLTKLKAEFSPLQQFAQQQQAVERRDRFFKSYPVLGDAKYEKILAAAAQSVSSQEFKSETEYFKALADSAAETIKGVLPEFDLGAAQKTTTKQPAGTTPRLPRTRVGGTGGTGGGGRQQTDETKDDSGSIF